MSVALLLPGWGTSPHRLEQLVSGLQDAGVDARTWRYAATGSIRRIADALAEEIGDLDPGAGPVHLVGHSLGGLVSASAVLDLGARAASVTTINTPWRGTWVAWTADDSESLGHELRWGSTELARLRSALRTHLRNGDGPRWTVLAAAIDLAATLATSLRVPVGDRLATDVVGVTGHSLSLMKQPMIDRIVDVVTTGDARDRR